MVGVVCPYKRHTLLEQVEQRSCNDPKVLHKLPIISSEAEETAHILGTLRNRPLLDRQDLAGICGDATFIDHMPQVSDLALREGAFGLFDLPVVVSEQLEHARDVLDMF